MSEAVELIESVDGEVQFESGDPVAVDLSTQDLSSDIFEAVCSLGTLRDLDLGYTSGFRNEWIPQLDKLLLLEQLCLNNTPFNDKAMKALPTLGNLRKIEILRTKITDSGFEELLRFPNLVMVSAGASRSITDAALKSLGRCPKLEEISFQFEAGSNITDAGLPHLAKLENLKSLCLYGTDVEGHGLDSLKNLPNLHELELDDTQVDDDGAEGLSGLVHLRILRLSSTMIDGAGLRHLAGMQQLELLELYQTDITDDAIEHLARLKSLKELNVRYTELTPSGWDQLKKALPTTKIEEAS